MRVAAIQLNSTNDKARNLGVAERLVADAAAAGAQLIALPEKWNLLGSPEDLEAGAETLPGGPSLSAARSWARASASTCWLAASPSARPTAIASSTPRA